MNENIWCGKCESYVKPEKSINTYDCPHCRKGLFFYVDAEQKKIEIAKGQIFFLSPVMVKAAYASATKRGKVNKRSEEADMILDIQAELLELRSSMWKYSKGKSSIDKVRDEIADVIICVSTYSAHFNVVDEVSVEIETVECSNLRALQEVVDCFKTFSGIYDTCAERKDACLRTISCMVGVASFYGIDIQKAVKEKMKYNETRSD